MGKIEVRKKTTVTSGGRPVCVTTIPKIIAELAGITRGQKLLWRYDGDKIIVEPVKENQ